MEIADWRPIEMGLRQVFIIVVNEGSKDEKNIKCLNENCGEQYFIIISSVFKGPLTIRCIYCCTEAIYQKVN